MKRILRTKQGDSRRLDYEKIIHIEHTGTVPLCAFFQTSVFGNLPDEKKELMREQLRAMREYLGILGKRCELEGIRL